MELNGIYKCSVCGNIVETTHIGGGELTCCDQKMQVMPELNHDAGEEKHVPVITTTDNGIKVHVGSVNHPMEENHHIEWIELTADGEIYRKYLKNNAAPEAEFFMEAKEVKARAYCNLHGLWVSD